MKLSKILRLSLMMAGILMVSAFAPMVHAGKRMSVTVTAYANGFGGGSASVSFGSCIGPITVKVSDNTMGTVGGSVACGSESTGCSTTSHCTANDKLPITNQTSGSCSAYVIRADQGSVTANCSWYNP